MKLLLPLLLLPFAVKAQTATDTAVLQTDTIKKIIYSSYYAQKFNGRKTANGEIYRSTKFTAAHRSLPFGTMVTVKNLSNQKTVKVKINDRGPFSKKFSLDLSTVAAKALGILHAGYAKVEISYLAPIRSKK